jgi:hypothetical protein
MEKRIWLEKEIPEAPCPGLQTERRENFIKFS